MCLVGLNNYLNIAYMYKNYLGLNNCKNDSSAKWSDPGNFLGSHL